MTATRNLILVLGDQLDAESSAFDGLDPAQDVVWMAEVQEESTHVWSSKQRIAVFLAAMRHFAQGLRGRGWRVDYTELSIELSAELNAASQVTESATLAQALQQAITRHQPQGLVLTAPGDWRVLQALQGEAQAAGLPLSLRDDRHFYSTVREFAAHAKGRKQLRLEYWYRELRVKHGILMQPNGSKPPKDPVGGQWNFDAENREPFDKKLGPQHVPPPLRFDPFEPSAEFPKGNTTTQAVIELVNTRFAAHPGSLTQFGWCVTRSQALQVLEAFIQQRLPLFGQFQDAMWQGEVWLYHSHLAVALNLKLLNPREVVNAAVAAYERGHAPLAAVEGFVRQILGWREYVRGIYWTQMPSYLERNAHNAHEPLPAWFWTGETHMACMRDAVQQTLTHGYAHHIQRLMVTGLYALLLGAEPKAVHEWYLSVYVDAVEWVELPNTLGMSQYADGGVMASKPYVASGKYIQRMSNYCQGCRYNPTLAVDAAATDTLKPQESRQACPFTTLYWDYLQRHESTLSANPRMGMQLKNLQRLNDAQRSAIRSQADWLRANQTLI